LLLNQGLASTFLNLKKCGEFFSFIKEVTTREINMGPIHKEHAYFVFPVEKMLVALTQQAEWFSTLTLLFNAEV
jgi:hypothetical protein